MDILKRFARGFSSQLFKLSLFFVATTAATVAVFGSPAPVKTALQDSGIYNKIVETVLTEAQGETSGIPLNDPAIKSAIQSAIPPQTFQTIIETILDGSYGWLRGDTAKPEINISMDPIKQDLANALGDYAVTRAQGLPACTLQQARELQINGVEPLKINCVPPGYDVASLKQQVINEVASSDDIIKESAITADTLLVGKEDASSIKPAQRVPFYQHEQLSKAPEIFGWLIRLPWILGSLALVSGVSLVFLHSECRRGLWVISRSVFVTGIVLIVGVLLVSYLVGQVRTTEGNGIAMVVPDFVRALSKQANQTLTVFGALYIGVGGIGMLALRFTRPKVAKPEIPVEPSIETSTDPETAEVKETKEKPVDKTG